MQTIHKYIVIVLVLFTSAFLTGCGGGSGGGSTAAATVPADFSGVWSGTVGGTALTYLVTQTGNDLVLTRTSPVLVGLTYTGLVNGNSAVVTFYGNGVSMGTLTWTLVNSTTGTMVANSCVAVSGFACGVPNGTALTLTRTVASTLSFPIQQAYKAVIASGLTKTFAVSGSCTGTASKTSAPATTPAVFEANPAALSAASTLTATLASTPGFTCTPTLASTSTGYFDSAYTPLGLNSPGVNYGVYLIAPIIPVTAVVGGTGVIGTETLYTDSTKATGNGRIDVSYVVEADTATTAIVNLIAKSYTPAGTLSATEQDRYRISATGALVPVSIDILYSTGMHLIFN